MTPPFSLATAFAIAIAGLYHPPPPPLLPLLLPLPSPPTPIFDSPVVDWLLLLHVFYHTISSSHTIMQPSTLLLPAPFAVNCLS
jgi:hypothetical protein